ncbi:MAG: hypothetical protein ACYCZH_02750 [Sulfuriferula sp.]
MNEHYIGIEVVDAEQEQAKPSYTFEQPGGRAIEQSDNGDARHGEASQKTDNKARQGYML